MIDRAAGPPAYDWKSVLARYTERLSGLHGILRLARVRLQNRLVSIVVCTNNHGSKTASQSRFGRIVTPRTAQVALDRRLWAESRLHKRIAQNTQIEPAQLGRYPRP
eukprot:1028253-Rhodomonas_salina.1